MQALQIFITVESSLFLLLLEFDFDGLPFDDKTARQTQINKNSHTDEQSEWQRNNYVNINLPYMKADVTAVVFRSSLHFKLKGLLTLLKFRVCIYILYIARRLQREVFMTRGLMLEDFNWQKRCWQSSGDSHYYLHIAHNLLFLKLSKTRGQCLMDRGDKFKLMCKSTLFLYILFYISKILYLGSQTIIKPIVLVEKHQFHFAYTILQCWACNDMARKEILNAFSIKEQHVLDSQILT